MSGMSGDACSVPRAVAEHDGPAAPHGIFGTTGSGKTETFYGFIVNFLLWCRGYCLSDGKADNKLAFATGRWRAVSVR